METVSTGDSLCIPEALCRRSVDRDRSDNWHLNEFQSFPVFTNGENHKPVKVHDDNSLITEITFLERIKSSNLLRFVFLFYYLQVTTYYLQLSPCHCEQSVAITFFRHPE